MTRISLAASTLTVFLAIAAGAAAQTSSPPTDFQGVVRDSSGAVVAGALVKLRAEGAALERVIETQADGTFVVRGVGAGRVHVTVAAGGFAPADLDVEIPAVSSREITLHPAPVVEQVRVVSGSRQDELRESLNTRVDVISRARMDDTGAESVAEVLRELPGVLTRRGSETAGAAGEQIQGIDSRQVLVLIDGQPILGARGVKRGVLNLDRQSTGRLERVEVVKGASSALYGSDAIGGVINLITRDAAKPLELSATASGGSHGDLNGRGEVGLRHGRLSGLFSGERHQHDGFDLTPTTFDTTGAAFRRTDGLAKLEFRIRPSLTAGGMVTGYANRSRGNSNGELGPQRDDVRDRTINGSMRLDWTPASATQVQLRSNVSHFDERSTGVLAPPRSTPLEAGSLDEDLTRIDASIAHPIGARQLLQGGAEYWSNRYAGVNRIAFDDGVEATTRTAWAQHRLSITGRLTTTVGVRVDSHSTFGTAVSPKAAANVRLGGGVHLRASYGRGFRAPDLGQLYYRFLNPTNFYQVLGNPTLKPERAGSFQGGAEIVSRGRRARLGVNAFRNDVRDLIESITLGMPATPEQLTALLAQEGLDPSFRPVLGRLLLTYKNVNDAATYGVEADGDLAISTRFSVGGAYTYLEARDRATGLDLTGRHRHHGHVRGAWALERIGLRANLRGTFYSSWIAARATVQGVPQNTIAPAFSLWDAAVSQRIGGGAAAFVAIDNLTGNQDPNTGVFTAAGTPAAIYRPEIGRTVRVGLRWSWSLQ